MRPSVEPIIDLRGSGSRFLPMAYEKDNSPWDLAELQIKPAAISRRPPELLAGSLQLQLRSSSGAAQENRLLETVPARDEPATSIGRILEEIDQSLTDFGFTTL
jgi:hypothetical protein